MTVSRSSASWIVVLAMAVLGIGVWRMTTSPHESEVPMSRPHAPADTRPLPQVAPPAGVEAPAVPEGSRPASEEESPAAAGVRVRPGAPLAEVNGVALTLKELTPLPEGVTEAQAMDPAVYDSLLQRAIDREVTFQAARTRGLQLNDDQRHQLEKARAHAMIAKPMSSEEAAQAYDAKANFETWELSARMMQEALLEASGGLAAFVTQDQVDSYYKEHSAEFGAMPQEPAARSEARKKIDSEIRIRLAPRDDPSFQQRLRSMVEELRGRAAVKQYDMPAGG